MPARVRTTLSEVAGRWKDVLLALAAKHTEAAGRARQATLLGVADGELRLGFEEVHAAHRDFFKDPDMLELLRAALEAETGSPLALRVETLAGAPDPARPVGPEDLSAYEADPLVRIVHSVFSATLRIAHRGDEEPPYHLGKSYNFREQPGSRKE